MTAEDPRHGTNKGYYYGCRETCCRTAHAAYKRHLRAKRYLMRSERLYVSSIGAVRRIRALQAIGWTFQDIDVALGRRVRPRGGGSMWAHNITRRPRIHLTALRAIGRVYDELSMTPGPSSRMRAIAKTRGWAPPLAWDDETIDDPAAEPWCADDDPEAGVDHVVVERILAGDWRLPCTKPEKCAVTAEWTGSLRQLERLTGWNIDRYTERSGKGAA